MSETARHTRHTPPPLSQFTAARMQRTVMLGLKSLWLHKLRSLLTALGIVFGVCSVIAMLAVGEGASHEAQEQIRRLGSNNIILRSLKPEGATDNSSEQSYVIEYGLTYSDLKRIRESIPDVRIVVPGRVIRTYVSYGSRRADCEVTGTVPWLPTMRSLRVLDGRFFTEHEMDGQKNVCVLTQQAALEIFPMRQPIGANVRVASDYYKVVGVIETEAATKGKAGGATTVQAANFPKVYIPLTAAKSRFGEVLFKRRSGSFEAERVELHEATIQVYNQAQVENVALIVEAILKKHHKKNDFQMTVPLELLRQAERTKQIFNIVLGAIAAISLIVGGIGIMNIMLASVTERTREIGIRRALGAKRRDIIIQFLIETVILSGTGGILGVILGVAIPFFITYFTEMETIVTPGAPIIAFSISALVGIIFGIYPALRAANMDPVEALRHE
jgi:putative ABC transport system permease protein